MKLILESYNKLIKLETFNKRGTEAKSEPLSSQIGEVDGAAGLSRVSNEVSLNNEGGEIFDLKDRLSILEAKLERK